MPALGANLKRGRGGASWRLLWEYLGIAGNGPGSSRCPLFYKAGAPASNAVADDPTQAPAFIIDTTNKDVYFCHTRVANNNFTLVKVSN